MRRDLAELLSRYGGDGIHGVPIGTAILEVMEIVRRHDLVISSDLSLLFAVIVMDEGLAHELDPGFHFDHAITPYVQHYLASAASAAALARKAEQFGIEVAELVGDLPGQLRRILEVIADGQFEVNLRANELDDLVHRIERLGNLVAVSILAAAVIDGLSELAAHPSERWTPRRLVLGVGVGTVASLGAYAGWRHTTAASLLGRFRSHARPRSSA